jgi:hypothetical protein
VATVAEEGKWQERKVKQEMNSMCVKLIEI